MKDKGYFNVKIEDRAKIWLYKSWKVIFSHLGDQKHDGWLHKYD